MIPADPAVTKPFDLETFAILILRSSPPWRSSSNPGELTQIAGTGTMSQCRACLTL